MKKSIGVLFVLVCLLALMAVLRASFASQSSVTYRTSIQVLTDRLDPAVGVPVKVDTGTNSAVAVTDMEGQLPWMALDPTQSGTLTITLQEHQTPGGLLLGMIEELSVPFQASPGNDTLLTTVSRTQPLAVPVQIEGIVGSTNNIYPPADDFHHWILAVPPDSPLRASVRVASLLDSASIDEFFAYRGHSVPPGSGYVRGIDMVVPAVQLGDSGFVLGLHLLGDLAGGADVDLFAFTNTPPIIPVGPPLAASVLQQDPDFLWLRVTGGIAEGHLAILVRPSGQPGSVSFLQDVPPTLEIPPNGGADAQQVNNEACDRDSSEATFTAALVASSESSHRALTECEPPTPNLGSWGCDPGISLMNNGKYTRCAAPMAVGGEQCEVIRMKSPPNMQGAGQHSGGDPWNDQEMEGHVRAGGGRGAAQVQWRFRVRQR